MTYLRDTNILVYARNGVVTGIETGATVVTNASDLLDGSIPGLVAENWAPR